MIISGQYMLYLVPLKIAPWKYLSPVLHSVFGIRDVKIHANETCLFFFLFKALNSG